MEAVFDRFIRVPKMIYGTRRLLFRHFIEEFGAEIEETELSALTIIADKYSVDDIKTVCRRVLTSHRVKRNKFVKAGEIAIPLSRMEQIDEELEENLVGFMEKTTMGKNLVKFYTVDDDAGDDKKKKKK